MAVWVWNEPEVDRVLYSEAGPVGRHIAKLARQCTRTAKRYANVSPAGDIDAGRPRGYMKAQIRWDMGRDLIGVYADISSPARTVDGEPYGLFMEVGTRAHIIEPKRPGGWLQWRDRAGRKHRAQRVNHPGTRPYAYLRRALYQLRGA